MSYKIFKSSFFQKGILTVIFCLCLSIGLIVAASVVGSIIGKEVSKIYVSGGTSTSTATIEATPEYMHEGDANEYLGLYNGADVINELLKAGLLEGTYVTLEYDTGNTDESGNPIKDTYRLFFKEKLDEFMQKTLESQNKKVD